MDIARQYDRVGDAAIGDELEQSAPRHVVPGPLIHGKGGLFAGLAIDAGHHHLLGQNVPLGCRLDQIRHQPPFLFFTQQGGLRIENFFEQRLVAVATGLIGFDTDEYRAFEN